jgi:ribonuclease D
MIHPPEPTVMAVDTETTYKEKYKLNPKAGLSPIHGRVRLVQFYFDNPITKKPYIIDTFKVRNAEDLIRLVLSNEKTIKILQNAKFDIKMIKASFNAVIKGIIFDPMLAGQLIDFNQKSNLDALSQIYLNIPVDKKLQRSDFSGELSHLQLEYASKDVRILPPLREALIQRMKQEKLIRIALLEFNAITLADLELNGFPVNYYQYQQLIKSLEEDVKELHSKKDPEYIKYYNINDKFGRSFFEKNIYQETNACHMDYRQISSPTGAIGNFGKICLEDIPNNECFRSCFTPQDKDNIFLLVLFILLVFKD